MVNCTYKIIDSVYMPGPSVEPCGTPSRKIDSRSLSLGGFCHANEIIIGIINFQIWIS